MIGMLRTGSASSTSTASAATWRRWCPPTSGKRPGDELEHVKPEIFMLAECQRARSAGEGLRRSTTPGRSTARSPRCCRATQPASALRAAWEESAAVPARRAAPAVLRQPRRAARDRPIRRARAPSPPRSLMFTLDGVPLLYNGMEVGDTTESGAPALFEKLPVFWPIAAAAPRVPALLQGAHRVAPRPRRPCAAARSSVAPHLRGRARRQLPAAGATTSSCWWRLTSRVDPSKAASVSPSLTGSPTSHQSRSRERSRFRRSRSTPGATACCDDPPRALAEAPRRLAAIASAVPARAAAAPPGDRERWSMACWR